jgi:hypothetical protein
MPLYLIAEIFFLVTIGIVLGRPSEDERCQLWYESGNVWPPQWQEESASFREKMDQREEEIMSIAGSDER